MPEETDLIKRHAVDFSTTVDDHHKLAELVLQIQKAYPHLDIFQADYFAKAVYITRIAFDMEDLGFTLHVGSDPQPGEEVLGINITICFAFG